MYCSNCASIFGLVGSKQCHCRAPIILPLPPQILSAALPRLYAKPYQFLLKFHLQKKISIIEYKSIYNFCCKATSARSSNVVFVTEVEVDWI